MLHFLGSYGGAPFSFDGETGNHDWGWVRSFWEVGGGGGGGEGGLGSTNYVYEMLNDVLRGGIFDDDHFGTSSRFDDASKF